MKTRPISNPCENPTCKFKARWKIEITEGNLSIPRLITKRLCDLHKRAQEGSVQAEIGRGKSVSVRRMH